MVSVNGNGNVNNNSGIFRNKSLTKVPKQQKIEIDLVDNKFKVDSGDDLLTATPASAYGPALALSGKTKNFEKNNITLADATKELNELFPKEGFASEAVAKFTPEEHETYLDALMATSPFMQTLNDLA